MKKYLLGLAVLLMGTAVMTSCSDDNDGPETYLQVYSTGAYVVNSGNMYSKIESSLTAIDYASSTATQNVFKTANGRSLGDTANDGIVYGNKIYLAVDQSNTIEVIDKKTKLGDNQLGPIRVKVNENAKIKMTLTDEFGNFLKGENTVIIRINGRTQIRQEIKNGKLDVILDTANFSAKKYTINMAISSNNRYEDVYRIPTTLTIIKRNAILNIDNTTTHTNGKTTNTCNSERYRWNSS